jgi:hypothetical protein
MRGDAFPVPGMVGQSNCLVGANYMISKIAYLQ